MSLVREPETALARYLTRALGATTVQVAPFTKLAGGAIQENWSIDARVSGGPRAGRLALVLRTDAPSAVRVSHDRMQEFAILKRAHQAGVMVPEPIAACADPAILGKPFTLMARMPGTAVGAILTRDDKWPGDRVKLAVSLGRELAKLHAVTPPQAGLEFLKRPVDPAREAIRDHRAYLDTLPPRPALEWGLRWLADRAPAARGLVLCHRDYRTGNYLADADGLTAILDWEFAGWSDPMEDLGWFCAKCWRFGAVGREAGGIGERADFYRGYREAGGVIDEGRVAYYEVMAHARWAIIALQQGARHWSGAESSLDLALTGRRVAELEYELLRLTGRTS